MMGVVVTSASLMLLEHVCWCTVLVSLWKMSIIVPFSTKCGRSDHQSVSIFSLSVCLSCHSTQQEEMPEDESSEGCALVQELEIESLADVAYMVRSHRLDNVEGSRCMHPRTLRREGSVERCVVFCCDMLWCLGERKTVLASFVDRGRRWDRLNCVTEHVCPTPILLLPPV